MHLWSGPTKTSIRRQNDGTRNALPLGKIMTLYHYRTCPSSSIARLFERVYNHLQVRGDSLCLLWEDRLFQAVLFEIGLESLKPRTLARLNTEGFGGKPTIVDSSSCCALAAMLALISLVKRTSQARPTKTGVRLLTAFEYCGAKSDRQRPRLDGYDPCRRAHPVDSRSSVVAVARDLNWQKYMCQKRAVVTCHVGGRNIALTAIFCCASPAAPEMYVLASLKALARPACHRPRD
jgi:hypothetical protein